MAAPRYCRCAFPFESYTENTLKLFDILKVNPYKLYSFEMKIDINLSNLREYYFQAVSNSSWAHEGYLVALQIADDPELIDEMRRLNNAFGIGVIRLDAEQVYPMLHTVTETSHNEHAPSQPFLLGLTAGDENSVSAECAVCARMNANETVSD